MRKIIAAAFFAMAEVAAADHLYRVNAADFRIGTRDNDSLVQLADNKTEWRIYRDPNSEIELLYPSNRRVITGCHYRKTCIALVGKTAGPDDYLVAFEIFDGALDTVAVDQAVFQREGDHWIAKGRNANHPVEPISGSGWQGLKSIVDCGVSDRVGPYRGAGECLWVVVSDGKRSIVADTQGTTPIDQDTMRSILSLRFRAR
jgi:hypothetical protein